MSDDAINRVRQLLTDHESKYRKSALKWKSGYRGLLIFSALLSTGAAVVGKLDYLTFNGASDVASILAALAAVTTTMIAALDFEVNWRINRRSRHDVNVIALESQKSNADADKLLAELQQVIRRRSEDLTKAD